MRLAEYFKRKTGYILPLTLGLHGCTYSRWPLLDPAGPIALDRRNLVLLVTGLMLLAVIPVFVSAAGFVLGGFAFVLGFAAI